MLPWLHYRSVKAEMLGWDPRISMYSFLKIYLFTFLVMLGLCRCAGFFSSCGEQGLLSSCGVLASYCGGFS